MQGKRLQYYIIIDYWGIGYDMISTREYSIDIGYRLGQYWYSLVDITSYPMPQ